MLHCKKENFLSLFAPFCDDKERIIFSNGYHLKNKIINNDSIISLNGEWHFITDKEQKLNFNSALKSLLSERKQLMKVPSNWHNEGLENFSGSVWFMKKFIFPGTHTGLSIIEFNGVDYFADIWLNGNYIGNHEGYFQKFFFDVSGMVNTGDDNILVVKVTSPTEVPKKVWPLNKKLIKGIFNHHDCRPGGWSYEHGQDQNTGGIWNDVKLLSTEKVYVKSLKISSKLFNKYKTARIKISCDYYTNVQFPLKDTLEFTIKTPSGKTITKKGSVIISKENSNFDFTFEISNPEFWWSWDLGKPSLYEVSFISKYIPYTKEVFGIREVILTKDKSFYLNGKKLFLRGTNIIPTQFLSRLTKEKIKELVKWMKDANINIVRVHAHVNRKEFYDECDIQGLLVWQDFALQWTYDNSPEFVSNACNQIKNMVSMHFNHPSISIWCCHNEPGNQINSLDPFLYDSVLSVDKTRIVRLASNYEEHPYDGWYWGDKEHFSSRPMGPLVTEFGAQALPGISSMKKFIPKEKLEKPDWKTWTYHNFQYEQTFNIAGVSRGKNINEFINNSQNYQSELLQTAIDFYRRGKNKDITGVFQFMFIDCWSSITWSVIDFYGIKKKGYHTLKKAFQPLYISLGVRQKKYFAGQKLNMDIWLINDFHKSYTDCKIIFILKKKNLGKIEPETVTEDSIQFFPWEKNEIYLPENLKAGKYNVSVELVQDRTKKVLSNNDFEIEIVKKEF